MSIESDIVTLLNADGTLTGILTGGVYGKQQIGKMGIDANNSATPNAYSVANQKQVLQPLLVLRLRALVPGGNRHDRKGQHAGALGTLECWFYDENSYTTIASGRDRVYALLADKTLANIGLLSLDNRIEGLRAQELNDAALLRDDYSVRRVIKP